jgi:hypothetical protein
MKSEGGADTYPIGNPFSQTPQKFEENDDHDYEAELLGDLIPQKESS